MMGGPVNDGGAGERYRNRNAGSWTEECPRPRPPPVQSYMGGNRRSQLVRKSGAGRGRGSGGGGGEFDGYQPAPPPRFPPVQQQFGSEIHQSQLVKKSGECKKDFRRSSSPSEGDPSSFKPSPPPLRHVNSGQALQQREDRSGGSQGNQQNGNGGFDNGFGQAPPLQTSYSAYKENVKSWSSVGAGGSTSSVYKGLTEEQIKNEVGWFTSEIERAVKKVYRLNHLGPF